MTKPPAGPVGRASVSEAQGARDPRLRRNAQNWTTQNEYAAPLYVRKDGKIAIRLSSAFKVNARGELDEA